MSAARTALAIIVAMTAILAPRVSGSAMADQFRVGLLSTGDKKGCDIETRPLAFGEYDSITAQARDGHGEVIYTCGIKPSRDAIKNIRIEISRGRAGSFDRAMFNGAERLHYNVFLDATRQTVWGDGSSGTTYYFDPHPPNKTPVHVTVYGRVPALQDATVGLYSDELQVQILF